jgi:hypothetical protein
MGDSEATTSEHINEVLLVKRGRRAARVEQDDATIDHHGAQCDDERRHLALREHNAIERTRDKSHHCGPYAHQRGEARGGDGGKTKNRADRKIDRTLR